MKKLILKKEHKFDYIYAIMLFVLLFAIAFPSFFYPPLSDGWEMFYFFHHLDERPGPVTWLHIFNHDPVEHIRYQPFSRVLPFIFFVVFGSEFVFFNIFNFLFYFCTAFLLYKFALYFSKNRMLVALFVGLFTFLFNHFDLALWSYHIYLLAGVSMSLIGFMSYMQYLKTAKSLFLFPVIGLFLGGMLCYEAFFLWPVGIIILLHIKEFRTTKEMLQRNIVKGTYIALATIYFLYFLFYVLTRLIKTYEIPLREPSDFLKLHYFLESGLLVFFNTLYNNLAVNFFPFSAFPVSVSENIYMAGPIVNYIDQGYHWIVFVGGAILVVILIFLFGYLYRKKYLEELKIMGFLFLLLLSAPYIIFFCRFATNRLAYGLTEFRYQYTPNAFMILTIIYMLDRFLKPSKITMRIVCCVVTIVFALNLYCIQKHLGIYDYHFMDLKKMLSNIKTEMNKGAINENNTIYIDRDIPDYLPHLCWNIEMGERFIPHGNYQWMFSKEELNVFSHDFDSATWIIDKENFSVVKKSPRYRSLEVRKINTIKDKWHCTVEKVDKYLSVAWYYKEKERYEEAIEMFEKAFEFGSSNWGIYSEIAHFYNTRGKYQGAEKLFKKAIEMKKNDASLYGGLGVSYSAQGKYEVAESLLTKAIELDPQNDLGYVDMGHFYNSRGAYQEADGMFRKALRINPKNVSARHGLGSSSISQGKYQEAEVHFKKGIELNPREESIYIDLGILYNSQQRYQEAEEMFKEALKINPDDERVYQELAECYAQQGRNQEAESILKKTHNINQ
jgi:tetratricopeptide (TPR) repeat protein